MEYWGCTLSAMPTTCVDVPWTPTTAAKDTVSLSVIRTDIVVPALTRTSPGTASPGAQRLIV